MLNLQITGCVSETGVTCCIKEAKAEVNKEAKDVFKKEIEFLRRLAHVRLPQLLSGMTNTDSSIAVHCPVH